MEKLMIRGNDNRSVGIIWYLEIQDRIRMYFETKARQRWTEIQVDHTASSRSTLKQVKLTKKDANILEQGN